jgi:chemotaxis protein methyltransferase CheR
MRPITDAEFTRFQRFIFDQAGITLSASKEGPGGGPPGQAPGPRTAWRALAHYFKLLASGTHAPEEVQVATDLLTTNETYFFRETKHFDFLRDAGPGRAQPACQPYRVWSAASSTGEEAYSIAMVLADCMETTPWEVLGTDISTQVLKGATKALYTMDRGRHIPPEYLRRFCLKGAGEHQGKLLIERNLRSRVLFRYANLNVALPNLGKFDFIFLRNVMIYFSDDTKREVVARVLGALKPGGYFFVGHSESLNGISDAVTTVAPSIFRKAP